MNHFDTDMIAVVGLILFMGVFAITFLKEAVASIIGLLLVVLMVWGDDVCSRKDRLVFYTEHFNRGGEVICRDDNAHPLLISKNLGWEVKGGCFFKGSRGVDILDDSCGIIGRTEPHCIALSTQIMIGSAALIGMLGWMVWMFRRLNTINQKHQESKQRKAKIAKAAEEMAPLYESDPELKEWTEFVGDYHEQDDETMQEDSHVEKNV